MSPQHTYTLIAPFYDAMLARATRAARQRTAWRPARRSRDASCWPAWAPAGPAASATASSLCRLDLTDAMLRRALPRVGAVDFVPVQGDAQCLPFADGSFDSAVLHLILAVVPQPAHCFAEIARVVKPGGSALVFDKFLRRGQPALVRRLANPLVRRSPRGSDVVFEDLLREAPELALEA